MVDVGLYAITPYQFRIAHELNLDNFKSPTVEERHFVSCDVINGQLSPCAEAIYAADNRLYEEHYAPDKSTTRNKNGFNAKTIDDLENNVFSLSCDDTNEKYDRCATTACNDITNLDPKVNTTEKSVLHNKNGERDGKRSRISSHGSGCENQSPRSPFCDQMDSSMFTSFNSDDVIVVVREFEDDTDTSKASSLADSFHSNDGDQTPKCNQSSEEGSQIQEDEKPVVRRRRRPRKLPEIPASVQGKSVACLMRTHSLADELSDADPVMRKAHRAAKARSWVASTTHSSSGGSQESSLFPYGFGSVEELGSPEAVDSVPLEQVHNDIIQMTMSQSQSNLELQLTGQSPAMSGPPNLSDSPMTPVCSIPHSMSMSLRDELESEGVPINSDLGSAFSHCSEYIDDEMPKLKKYFGDISNSQCNKLPSSGRARLGSGANPDGENGEDLQSSRGYYASFTRDDNTHTAGISRSSSSSTTCSNYSELEAYDATHRGCHKFVPRHNDEMFIEIGDLLFVEDEADDLWCEGLNLRSGQRGIFPAAYATDLSLLEYDGISKFKLRFLGSVEVNQHKGDDVICTAIQRVAGARRRLVDPPVLPLYCLEINEYGIKMIDLSKKSRNSPKKSSIRERLAKILNKEYKKEEINDIFFSLKHVSFCGYHPKNERYFAFITKHPMESRFACHVFLSHRSTRPIASAVRSSFKKFYQEYMAFMHPTEDIYME